MAIAGKGLTSDEDMLLNREWARVELEAEDLDAGEDSGGEATDGERQKLSDETRDGDRGITEEEELVEAGDEDGPRQTDNPGAEGVDGHVWVVGVGYRRTDLGVGRVVLDIAKHGFVEVGVIESSTSLSGNSVV